MEWFYLQLRKILFFLVSFVLLFNLFALTIPIKTVNASSWLTGWIYRKSHIIESSSGAGTNYQIEITVNYGSGSDSGNDVYVNEKSQTDFEDIVFTDLNSDLLYQWMQEVTVSDNAVFWINVTGDLTAGDVLIYMYYGNVGASLRSDFDNTFIFGDTFDNATLDTDKWVDVDGTPVYTIDNNNNWLEVTDMASTQWGTGVGFHSLSVTLPIQWILEDAYSGSGMYRIFTHDGIDDVWASNVAVTNTSDTWNDLNPLMRFSYTDSWGANKDVTLHFEAGATSSSRVENGDQTDYIISRRVKGFVQIYETGVLRVNGTATTEQYFHLGLGRFSTYGFGTTRFGAFKVRKFVTPEPVHGAWGDESMEGKSITTYNQSGSVFMIEGVKSANGTEHLLANNTVIELQGIINKTYTFTYFNWTTDNAEINPYNYTVWGNDTIWLMVDPVGAGGLSSSWVLSGFLWIFLILIPIIVIVLWRLR